VDFCKLRTGDMVCCGGHGPMATVTRIVTAGGSRWNDSGVAVHTGLIVEWAGQKLIAEMLGRGITLSAPSRYEGKHRRYILEILRNAAYDGDDARDALNRRVARMYRNTIEYDFKGLMSFVFDKCKDDPRKYYCSEFFAAVTVPEVSYPDSFMGGVSPYELQHAAGWKHVWEIL